jgi:polyisoprenoid-binding protein YceI
MTRVKALWRSHPVLLSAGSFVLVLFLGGSWAAAQMFRVESVTVDWDVPDAPELVETGPGQTVYRIDPSRSTASYEVAEHLAGVDGTAVGETQGIAGDILVDDTNPADSQLGEIVVNVEQLTSDKSLRDKRLRVDFLDSHEHPLARYRATEVRGLPDEIDDGVDYDIELGGELTIKETTRPTDVSGTVRREDDELHITASADILLSDFDIGPIRVIGLVSTGDEATLSFDLVAPRADDLQIEERESTDDIELAVASGDDPLFSETVQPVLETGCASCHEPGGSGSGEWELADARDAAEIASGIGLVTETRYMPPWLASEEGVPLQHSLRLTDEQLSAVDEWVDAGGPLDVDPDTRIEAVEEAGPTLRDDLELRIPEPYTGTVEKENDYRCFVLDPELTEPTTITGYEFLPDQLPIVHHALVYRLDGDARPALDAAEARDDDPGWECFGGINVQGTSLSPSGRGGSNDLVMGWAPGQPPSEFAEGTAIHLDADDLFVVQLHYHVSEDPPPDQSALALQLGDGDPADYDDIEVTTYLAPAEIPCEPGTTAPRCDREVEMEALAEQYGPVGPTIANGLHLVCGTTPGELARLEDGIARSSCDHEVRDAGQVLAVLGHMHEIGSTFRMTLNPGTPDETVLLDIPRWDFDWQFNYAIDEDVVLEEGDTIRVECSWDRALAADHEEPHYISWAEGTEDEMCYSTVATRVPSD